MDVTSYEISDVFFLHPMVLYFRLFRENVHKNLDKFRTFSFHDKRKRLDNVKRNIGRLIQDR